MVHTYSNSKNKVVKVDNKVIGHFEGNTFIKPIFASKHALRKPKAFAIDAEAFDTEIEPNATEIIIKDKETGLAYHCSTETFSQYSFKLNRGYGNQYAMLIDKFQVSGNGHRQLSLWECDVDA